MILTNRKEFPEFLWLGFDFDISIPFIINNQHFWLSVVVFYYAIAPEQPYIVYEAFSDLIRRFLLPDEL